MPDEINEISNPVVNDLVENIKLALINEQNIFPIVGFDCIPVKENGVIIPYLDYLSHTIAEDKKIQFDPGLSGFELFNFITHQLLIISEFDRRGTTQQISKYAISIHSKVDKTYLEELVSIFPFRYFLNLTFTTHLSEVMQDKRSFPKIGINESSFPFQNQVLRIKKPEDLIKNECGFLATIYNLYGVAYSKGQPNFNYYYSDDDMLDFISHFNKRFEVDLKNYKEIVMDSSLLFLGCQYPDWLLRVLINTLKPGTLDSNNKMQARIFIDYCNDNSTNFFLSKHKLQYQKHLQTRPFINNLKQVLSDNHFALNINNDTNQYIFISYARDNINIVQTIICQLAIRMNVWFDRIKLFPGDLIDDEIKKGISNCKLFLPIITKESESKKESDYVKQEWIYYCEKFKDAHKVIPLIEKGFNVGILGFDVSKTFSQPGANIFYVSFDENGLSDEDIDQIKNRL